MNGFGHRLFLAGGVAREKLSVSRGGVKRLYGRRAEQHGFGPGDQVLVLVPIVSFPFQAKCTGPGTITEKASQLNYVVAAPERRRVRRLPCGSPEAVLSVCNGR